MPKKLIPIETLRKLLRCEPEIGKLFWRERPVWMFSGKHCESTCRGWNKRLAGKEAFTAPDARNYLTGRIFNETFKAHRVIWALYYGEWPDHEVCHDDGDPANNRIDNLYDGTHEVNMKNVKKSKNNTSGMTGVYWDKQRDKWNPKIKVNGKSIHLGYFDTFEEAVAARKAAEIKYGFHPNHGQ